MNRTALIIILLCFGLGRTGAQEVAFSEDMDNMYKTLVVHEVVFDTPAPTTEMIDSMFVKENVPFNNIDTENWEGYDYKPTVKFRMAYSKDELYLQYYVKEPVVKAVYGCDTGALPYKDSCLEFFSIPAGDSIYYNLELNCIAKGTFAGGAKRTERTRFGEEVLSKIRRSSTLGSEPFGIKENHEKPFEYTVTAAIPLEVFGLSRVEPLKGRTIRANFYKCGDEMPEPHYLSWNPIGTEQPNFHTPEYFGYIKFE